MVDWERIGRNQAATKKCSFGSLHGFFFITVLLFQTEIAYSTIAHQEGRLPALVLQLRKLNKIADLILEAAAYES